MRRPVFSVINGRGTNAQLLMILVI